MKLHSKLSCIAIAILSLAMGQAQAGVLFKFSESGDTVVMQSSGVLDTSKLVATTPSHWGGVGVETNGGGESDIMGDTSMGNIDRFFGFHDGTDYSPWIGSMFTSSNFYWNSTGTTQFTTYVYENSARTPGIAISADDMNGFVWAPDISWSKTGTLASLGLTAGTYSIVDAQTKEFITIQIGESNQVPEPASLALLGLGLAGVCLTRRKRQA